MGPDPVPPEQTLISVALVIFAVLRRREKTVPAPVPAPKSDYRFHGKLSLYPLIVEGGEREIRPFNFVLQGIEEKRITLKDAFDSIGDGQAYPEVADIALTAGPEESIFLRNGSSAVVRVMGRDYGTRSKVQLFYGQKCYFVFESDTSELEMSYKEI